MKRFASIPVQVKAGTYDVAVTFLERARVESDEFVGFLPGDEFSRGDREPRIQGGVQVMGPFDSPGVSDTPSRRRIFVCRPDPAQEKACVRRIAATLARRAFRRPVTDADIDSLMPYFDNGRTTGFDDGVEQLFAAVLGSPDFLFRAIKTPATAKEGTPFPLSELELASRLSFFLWSQGPDDALLEIAAAGKLRTPDALRTQAQRMLRDRRASGLVRNFALKWLDLDNLNEVVPDPNLFPSFDDGLRRDLATEIESLVYGVLRGVG